MLLYSHQTVVHVILQTSARRHWECRSHRWGSRFAASHWHTCAGGDQNATCRSAGCDCAHDALNPAVCALCAGVSSQALACKLLANTCQLLLCDAAVGLGGAQPDMLHHSKRS